MNQKIEEKTRSQIAGFLPDAIFRALTSYRQFSEQEASEEAKEFTAHHNACKVAIAHIELLIKLARWADLPGEGGSGEDGVGDELAALAAMMARAEEELRSYQNDDKG